MYNVCWMLAVSCLVCLLGLPASHKSRDLLCIRIALVRAKGLTDVESSSDWTCRD
jgi:hypothetical protein